VGCEHHCYYCYALNQAETDWAEEILIHRDLVGQLRQELAALSPQTIYLGWNTDPYQPCEVKYHQTRQVLELLSQWGFSVSLLTKSDRVIRDIDLLRKMGHPSVSVSVAFHNERIRRIFEARAPDNEARIRALRQLKEAGIRTSALICPVFPHITDVESLMDRLVPHADAIWIYGLSMKERSDRNWRNTQILLSRHFPTLREPIEAAAFSAQHPDWVELRQKLESIKVERQLDLKICL
jgi:DNA repair photolyase